jgi:hypothetical protein
VKLKFYLSLIFRPSCTKTDPILKTKYPAIHKLANELMSTQKNVRPNCDSILTNNKKWKLSIDELHNDSQFKQFKSCAQSAAVEDNFHELFIQTKIKCQTSANKSVLQNFFQKIFE